MLTEACDSVYQHHLHTDFHMSLYCVGGHFCMCLEPPKIKNTPIKERLVTFKVYITL